MFRWLVILVICCVLAFLGATVPLGKRTFFGHIRAIWSSESVKDLKEGIHEKADPAAEKLKRGVERGLDSMEERERADRAGSGATAPVTP